MTDVRRATRSQALVQVETIPSVVPAMVRGTVSRHAAALRVSYSKPDFAGQLWISVEPVGVRGAKPFTWAIVGNHYEQHVSYLTFIDHVQRLVDGRPQIQMQRPAK